MEIKTNFSNSYLWPDNDYNKAQEKPKNNPTDEKEQIENQDPYDLGLNVQDAPDHTPATDCSTQTCACSSSCSNCCSHCRTNTCAC